MFADLTLAARIERAESRLSTSIAAAARDHAANEGVLIAPLGGGAAVFTRPGSPINKGIGAWLGGQPLDDAELAAVEVAWRARGEAVRIELSTLAAPEVGVWLTARGYRLHGFENVLGRSLAAEEEHSPGDIAVEVAGASEAERWFDVMTSGFAHPDGTGVPLEEITPEVLKDVFRDLFCAPGLRRYLARAGGEIAGSATLRIDREERVALLCGAATLPPFRRRGVQTALLRARLADARREGCEIAIVTTAPASGSQANVTRQGFSLLYARAILIRPLEVTP